jgi:hypothetical protein
MEGQMSIKIRKTVRKTTKTDNYSSTCTYSGVGGANKRLGPASFLFEAAAMSLHLFR